MTEELEKKLNEILGMKKQLEELTTDKKMMLSTTIFVEQKRKTKIYFYIFFVISIAIMVGGLVGIYNNSGKYQMVSLFTAIVGFESTVLMKLWYHIVASKLLVLQELKLFELRMTELLKK